MSARNSRKRPFLRPGLLAAALTLLAATLLAAPAKAGISDIQLPEIGTAGIRGLSIEKERALGDSFMRLARSQGGTIFDPVMNEYLDTVGGKLVAQADHVYFPFEFFLVNNPSLNAAAFLGGKIQVNTGLFHYTDTEDQFASVLAHEISHVTQRHVARFIENRADQTHLTAGGIIGAIIMGLLNPAVGMAAMSTTVGVSMQSAINFTRDNESEADRLGIALLNRAGYNPDGMSQLFEKLQRLQGNLNPMLAFLVDHPLSQIRIAEAKSRAARMPKRPNTYNPDFDFARARSEVCFQQKGKLKALRERLEANPDQLSLWFRNYALAAIALEEGDYARAHSYINQLGNRFKNNLFVVDLLTDIDLKQGNYATAQSRLLPLYQRMPRNAAVVLNLANAYLEGQKPKEAIRILERFLTHRPHNLLAHELLTDAYLKAGDRCHALTSRGDAYALTAGFQMAVSSYNEAINTCRGHNEREILRAKAAQVMELRKHDEELLKDM